MISICLFIWLTVAFIRFLCPKWSFRNSMDLTLGYGLINVRFTLSSMRWFWFWTRGYNLQRWISWDQRLLGSKPWNARRIQHWDALSALLVFLIRINIKFSCIHIEGRVLHLWEGHRGNLSRGLWVEGKAVKWCRGQNGSDVDVWITSQIPLEWVKIRLL